MLNEVLKMKKMKSVDIKTCEKRNKRTGGCILKLFTEVPSKNLKDNVKQALI